MSKPVRPERFQYAVRNLLRDRLLDAAADLMADQDWSKVRMADIADRAGVSRKTVYNEFGSKPRLASALALRNFQSYVARVEETLMDHRDDIADAFAAVIEQTMRIAADDPLVKAYLTGGQDGAHEDLIAALTTESEPILVAVGATAKSWIRRLWPDLGLSRDELDIAVDCLVRMTSSYILIPGGSPEEIGRRVRSLARRLLAPAG